MPTAKDEFWDTLRGAWLEQLKKSEDKLKAALGRAEQFSTESENLSKRSRRAVAWSRFWFNEMMHAQECVVACQYRDPTRMPSMPDDDDTNMAEIVAPLLSVVDGGKH